MYSMENGKVLSLEKPNTDGTVNHDPDAPEIGAAKEIKAQTSRNTWTVLPDVNYIGDWNNFKTENNIYINRLFNYTEIEF